MDGDAADRGVPDHSGQDGHRGNPQPAAPARTFVTMATVHTA